MNMRGSQRLPNGRDVMIAGLLGGTLGAIGLAASYVIETHGGSPDDFPKKGFGWLILPVVAAGFGIVQGLDRRSLMRGSIPIWLLRTKLGNFVLACSLIWSTFWVVRALFDPAFVAEAGGAASGGLSHWHLRDACIFIYYLTIGPALLLVAAFGIKSWPL